MEKRISFRDFQSVKSVARAIDPKLREKTTVQKKALAFKEEAERQMAALKERLDAKMMKIKEEYDICQAQIDALEAGILTVTGFHVTDLVKKVVEPTGATDKEGKPIKVTKYLPTNIVSYDDNTKEFVITVPDEEPSTEEAPTEEVPSEDGAKSSDEIPMDTPYNPISEESLTKSSDEDIF